MWFQVATLCLAILGANAHPVAVSHVNRIDHFDGGHLVHHGHIGHLGLGHGLGHHGHVGHLALSHHGLAGPRLWSGLAHHGGHAVAHHGHGWDHAWSHPNYEFSYSVNDPHTGDHKQQHQRQIGDHVVGGYSLVEPDGNVRSVHYSSEAGRGFTADVHHSTAHHHIIPHHHH